jgi:regulator of protease activity HflC (stomatin/prohibitin superfamily)
METLLCFVGTPILAALVIFLLGFRVIDEYERAVVFRLGRYKGLKGPGWFWIIPLFEWVESVVDIRVITLDVPPQDCITHDNVTVRVDAVTYFRVVDAMRAVIYVKNYYMATFQIAQTTLRSIIGQVNLDELLADRERINEHIRTVLDEHTDPWGVKVTLVEIKDVQLPDTMKRSMAKQAEAERERRAKIIRAEGELSAAEKLVAAAQQMATSPGSMQLRYLETLNEIAQEKNSTIVFPLPIELFEVLLRGMTKS